MSILRWLGLTRDTTAQHNDGSTESVQRIVAQLEQLEPEQARMVAAFAYLLGRVANADLEISDDEVRTMEQLVREHGGLDQQQAQLVVQIATRQTIRRGGTDDFLVARELRQLTSVEQRLELLGCLFAVSAADDSISSAEEATIRQIAHELELSHEQFIQARLPFSGQREVMRLARAGRDD